MNYRMMLRIIGIVLFVLAVLGVVALVQGEFTGASDTDPQQPLPLPQNAPCIGMCPGIGGPAH